MILSDYIPVGVPEVGSGDVSDSDEQQSEGVTVYVEDVDSDDSDE